MKKNVDDFRKYRNNIVVYYCYFDIEHLARKIVYTFIAMYLYTLNEVGAPKLMRLSDEKFFINAKNLY